MMSPPGRAAVYVWISLNREMDGLAIDRQRGECLRITMQRDWEVAETYVGQSRLATARSTERPDRDRMAED